MMDELIQRSRPADDVVKHILQEVENKVFYILPDREVKDYVSQRMEAVINQTPPHPHNIEKIMAALTTRVHKKIKAG
jgi:predicted DNA-binding protein (UPF0278 family)